MKSIGITQKLFTGIVVVRVVMYIIMMILVESSKLDCIQMKNWTHMRYLYTMEITVLKVASLGI